MNRKRISLLSQMAFCCLIISGFIQNLNAQTFKENSIWIREVPEYKIKEFVHFAGKERMFFTLIHGMARTEHIGNYKLNGNILTYYMEGYQYDCSFSNDQVVLKMDDGSSFIYNYFTDQQQTIDIRVLPEDLIKIQDPFIKIQTTVTNKVNPKYYGLYENNSRWDSKINLSPNAGESYYHVQTLKPNSEWGEEEDYEYFPDKEYYPIIWGFIVEDGAILFTNPMISASINNFTMQPVDNCMILLFQYPDETVSYLIMVEAGGRPYLISKEMVFEKIN